MASLMNDAIFKPVGNKSTVEQVFKEARRNPQAFEEYVRQTNPEAYNRAMQLRNASNNPQALVMQMAQMKGIDMSLINRFSKM